MLFFACLAAAFAAGGETAYSALSIETIQVAPPRLGAAVGRVPEITTFPILHSLNRFRQSPLLITLGGRDYHLSIQAARNGDWHLVVLKRGGNVHEPAATFVLRVLTKPQQMRLDSKKFLVGLATRGGKDFVTFSSDALLTDIPRQEIAIDDIKDAVYAAAIPLPSIGPTWRVVYERELWLTASMPSLVFFERVDGHLIFHVVGAKHSGTGVFPQGLKADGTIVFHLIPANAIDDTREHIVSLGQVRVGLKTDGKGNFVVRTIR